MIEVKPGMEDIFEDDLKKVSLYISSIEGYIKHSLQKCIEQKNKYALLVEWRTLENHTIDFRESKQYLKWKTLLHHCYNPFPIVEHFKKVY